MSKPGRRVFLTGATGFVGSYAVEHLRRDPSRQLAILLRPGSDRSRLDPATLKGVTIIEGSLDDLGPINQTLKAFAPDTVIHLAWEGVAPNDRNNPAQIRNIQAATELLDMAKNVGATSWISMGSQAEYGPHLNAIRETDATRPTTLYGAAKLSACHLTRLQAAQHNMRYVWLRLFSTYGPKDHPRWLIPHVTLKLLKGERPSLTEGQQKWDYVHVRDIADAVVAVADDYDAEGVYNIGAGRIVTVRRVVERIRDLIDPKLPLGFGELLYRPDQVMHLEADISRLQRAVNWTPKIDLDQGLAETVEYYRAHPA